MPENPYKLMLDIVRRDSEQRAFVPWVLGRVRSVSPLTVEYAGKVLDWELLADIRVLDELSAKRILTGDQVAMLRDAEGSTFVVLCKVVKP